MSYGPATIDCPEWVEDIPADREHEFRGVAQDAIVHTINAAQHNMLASDLLKTLHWMLFERFVPRDYYAGNFRQDDATRPCLGKPVTVDGVDGADFRIVI